MNTDEMREATILRLREVQLVLSESIHALEKKLDGSELTAQERILSEGHLLVLNLDLTRCSERLHALQFVGRLLKA